MLADSLSIGYHARGNCNCSQSTANQSLSVIWQAEFEQKQVDMREQVVKFEKFIQENDAKRIRAEAKAKQVGSRVTHTIRSFFPVFLTVQLVRW